MPRIKLTKSTIDALRSRETDVIYWDKGCPGFGVKVTPLGRKVFLVLYRTAGAASKLRKFTIGPYGKVTLHQARTLSRDPISRRHIELAGMLFVEKTKPASIGGIDHRARPKCKMCRSTADLIKDITRGVRLA